MPSESEPGNTATMPFDSIVKLFFLLKIQWAGVRLCFGMVFNTSFSVISNTCQINVLPYYIVFLVIISYPFIAVRTSPHVVGNLPLKLMLWFSSPVSYSSPVVIQTPEHLEKLFPQCQPFWHIVPSIAVSSVSDASLLAHHVLLGLNAKSYSDHLLLHECISNDLHRMHIMNEQIRL